MILVRKEKSKKKNQPSCSSWALQLNLQANPKSFKFYFKATNFVLIPFNFALRVSASHPHLSHVVDINKSRSVKSKLLGVMRKLRFGAAKKESLSVDVVFPPSHFHGGRGKFDANEEQKCIGSTITGFIGPLLSLISQKNQKGLGKIILYLSIINVFLLVIFILSGTLKNWENNIRDYLWILLNKSMDMCSLLVWV